MRKVHVFCLVVTSLSLHYSFHSSSYHSYHSYQNELKNFWWRNESESIGEDVCLFTNPTSSSRQKFLRESPQKLWFLNLKIYKFLEFSAWQQLERDEPEYDYVTEDEEWLADHQHIEPRILEKVFDTVESHSSETQIASEDSVINFHKGKAIFEQRNHWKRVFFRVFRLKIQL